MRTFSFLALAAIMGCGASSPDDTPSSLNADASRDAGPRVNADRDLDAALASKDAGRSGSRGAEGLFGHVIANLAPEQDCTFDAAGNTLPEGLYDLGAVNLEQEGECSSPYRMHLLLEVSDERRTAGGVLQLLTAEVRLGTLDGALLSFADPGMLPNPLQVSTSNTLELPSDGSASQGIASIEAIPLAYGEALRDRAGERILAEVRVRATTVDDRDLELQAFTYPIRLCSGCLSACRSSLDAMHEAPEGECHDNAGVDGRLCVDHGC